VVRIRLLTFLAGATAKITLILSGAPLTALGAAVFFEALLTAVGLLWQGYRCGASSPWRWHWDRREAHTQLTLSWPLLVSGLLVALFFKLDQVLLGWLRGVRDVGLYHSALRLVEIWNFLPMIILPSVFPGLIRLHQKDPAAYRNRLRRLFAVFSLAAWLIMALNLVLAGGLVTFIFGDGFWGSGGVLAILAVTLHFHFSSSIRAQIMLIEGLTLYHTPIALGSIGLMIGLDLLLIPPLGPAGAALGACLSACFSGLVSSFLFPKLRPIGMMQLNALFGGFLWQKRIRN
jgi:O-antigen/teichoic acid export membrane protein